MRPTVWLCLICNSSIAHLLTFSCCNGCPHVNFKYNKIKVNKHLIELHMCIEGYPENHLRFRKLYILNHHAYWQTQNKNMKVNSRSLCYCKAMCSSVENKFMVWPSYMTFLLWKCHDHWKNLSWSAAETYLSASVRKLKLKTFSKIKY